MTTQFYEDKRDKVAARLLRKRGVDMLVRNEAGEVDDESGEVTYGDPEDHDSYGVFKIIDEKLWKFIDITTQSREVVLAAEPFAKEDPEFVPKIGHLLIVGTQEFKIIGVIPVSPANITILYRLFVTL